VPRYAHAPLAGYTATNLQHTPGMGPAWLADCMNGLFAQSVEVGAQPQLYAAVGADIMSGDYTGPVGGSKGPAAKAEPCARALNDAAAAQLWALSAKLVGMDYLA